MMKPNKYTTFVLAFGAWLFACAASAQQNSIDAFNVAASGGRVIVRTFGFLLPAGQRLTALLVTTVPMGATFVDPPVPVGPPDYTPRTSLGLVLFDRPSFEDRFGDAAMADAQVIAQPYSMTEREEEDWIDDNSVPLLVNRYNGTLVRGE
jgi:hypothetical protein